MRDDLRAGRLVRVLEDAEPPPLPVCLVFAHSRRPSARLMAFIDLASERLAAVLGERIAIALGSPDDPACWRSDKMLDERQH